MKDKEKNKVSRKNAPSKKVPKAAVRNPESEIDDLRARLHEAEETLNAIRQGEVDALVVSSPRGEQIYELKGAEHPYRVYFEIMTEGGATISREGLILACNRSFADMVRIDLEKLCGRSFYDFVRPEERREIERFLRNAYRMDGIASQRGMRKEAALKTSYGLEVPVQLAMSVINEIDETHVCVVVTDLTDQKRAEWALRRSHDELELKVRERTAELQAHKEQLQAQNEELRVVEEELNTQNEELRAVQEELESSNAELEKQNRELRQADESIQKLNAELSAKNTDLVSANRELEQFAYIVSHDLQEPLRMVSSYMQLLERRYKGKLDKDADDFINFAVKGSEHMQILLRELLMFSRIGREEEPFVITDLNISISRAFENLKNSIDESGAEIICEKLPSVYSHPVQMVQLFQNLVGNAIKFRTDEKPVVRITVQQNGDEWVIQVRDNGIGIKPEYFDSIFLMFKRLHGRDKYPGTGIGLAICKKIVEQQGGRIWVESEPGKGTAFYFTVPEKRQGQGQVNS